MVFHTTFWVCNIIAISLYTGAPKWANLLTTIMAGYLVFVTLKNFFEKNKHANPIVRILSIPLAFVSFTMMFTILSWIDETLARELAKMSPSNIREEIISHASMLYFWAPNMILDISDGNFASAARVGGKSVAGLFAILLSITFLVPPWIGTKDTISKMRQSKQG